MGFWGFGVRLRSFNEKSGDELIDKIKEIKRNSTSISGYILDLRNNPGGLLSQAIKISDSMANFIAVKPGARDGI